MIDVIPLEKLNAIIERFEFLEVKLNQSLSASELKELGQEYSELKNVVPTILEFKKILNLIEDSKELLNDNELKDLAKDEILFLEKKKEICKKKLLLDLIPKNKIWNGWR